ncbi:MAG: PASTA domain-containing protein [candidate division WOR-3 bacterium]
MVRKLRFFLYVILGLALFSGLSVCCLNALMPLVVGRGKVEVPALIGMDQEEAQTVLRRIGLRMRTDTSLPSRDYPEGTVMAQNPPPGTHVKKGRRVSVTLSAGVKKVVIPDLEGEEGEHGRAILRKLGLVVRIVTIQTTDMEAGYIIGTRPRSGTQVDYGDTVTLIISAGLPQFIPDTIIAEIESLEAGADSGKTKPQEHQ